MLKLCDKSIVKPLSIIFKNCKLSVNQLLSINYDIFSNFDCDPPKETRAVFLDISKAFDKIWLPGLIFKIKSFEISDDLLELIRTFYQIGFRDFF